MSRLLRAKWLILGVFVLLSAATIPWVWLFSKPTYQASAMVRVSPVTARIVFVTEENASAARSLYGSFLNTQVSIIGSPPVLQRVLDRGDVQATQWYKEKLRTLRTSLGGTPPTALERLKRILSVETQRNTELIDVSATTFVPKDAAVVVNAVVDEYKTFSDNALREIDLLRRETLSGEQAGLQKEVGGLVATKFNLSQAVGTTDPEELRSGMASHLDELESEREQLRLEHEMTRWDLDATLSAKKKSEGGGEGSESIAETDSANRRYTHDVEWRGFNTELKKARYELELARQQYGESHPRIKQLLARIDHAARLLRERETQVDVQREGAFQQAASVSGAAVAFLDEAALERLVQRQSQELELREQAIAAQRMKVAEAGDIAEQIARYDEDIHHKRGVYEAVRTRLQALEMEAKAPARIGVAAHAVAPTEPHRDRRFLLTVMALAGAMMIGLVVGHVRTNANPKILEASDVRHTVRVPFLGQLPAVKDPAADCDPMAAECMRMVRTALLERFPGNGSHSVLITSASSRAGKTAVALELARSLAHLGKKTLLVEADLRRPALSERLGLEFEEGLAALLTGVAEDRRVIVPSAVPKLDVLPAGNPPENFSPELLANGVFASCLHRWKKSYDFILLDSSPVLPVADARILAGQTDGTVMVLRSSHCRQADVIQAYADLSAAGGSLLGTVLVGVRSERGYGYSYDYHVRSGRDSSLLAD